MLNEKLDKPGKTKDKFILRDENRDKFKQAFTMYGTNWIQISRHLKNIKPRSCRDKARTLLRS